MSEYWVSHKKYFCKYCEIYIADDAPSRRQHEVGLRHKGNRERFVRGLYKQGERRKKDLEEEKREMARIEAAANSSFARDISSGNASLASSSRSSQDSTSVVASKKPEKPTSVWSNYSTAQSLGITDPDEERINAEMERRRTQGVAGDWEVVAPPPPPLSGDAQALKEEDSKEGVLGDALPQKREAEAPLEEEDERNFKLRKRTIGVGLGEIWDPGDIPIKLKSRPKMEDASAPILNQGKPEDESDHVDTHGIRATSPVQSLEKPEWRPTGWKRVVAADNSPPTSRNEEFDKPVEMKDKPDESNETRQTADKSKWQSARWKPATTSAHNVPTGTNVGTGKQEPEGADLSIRKVEESTPLHTDSAPRHLQNDAHHGSNNSNSEMVSAKPKVKEEEIEAPITPQPPEGLFRKRKVPAAGRGRR